MTSLDTASAFYHDARWWLNQYFEFKQSFPNIHAVSFSAFNNSGLAINMFYPTNTLRILELPLVILNIENPYFVIGYLNVLSILLIAYSIYLITSTIINKNKLAITILFTTLILLPPLEGPVNSITQQLATAFMYLGIYGILKEKMYYVFFATILLLNTSISSSIIAAIAFISLMIYSKASKKTWLLFIGYGTAGVIVALPIIIPILLHISSIMSPTNSFSAMKQPTLIFGFFLGTKSFKYLGLIRLLSLISAASALYVSLRNGKLKENIPLKTTIIILLIITALPRLNSYLTTPIQQGTWSRVWPITIMLILLTYTSIFSNKKNYKKTNWIIWAISFINIILCIVNLPFSPSSNQTKLFNHNLTSKNWHDLYSEIQTSSNNENESTSKYIRTIKYTADLSPDYIPKKATLKDNHIAYQPPVVWKSKYGLEKHAIDKGRKLKITINPKHNVTPLGVWHYDFLKYNVSSTKGQVVVSNHDMFEYHGTKKTTIFISLK